MRPSLFLETDQQRGGRARVERDAGTNPLAAVAGELPELNRWGGRIARAHLEVVGRRHEDDCAGRSSK